MNICSSIENLAPTIIYGKGLLVLDVLIPFFSVLIPGVFFYRKYVLGVIYKQSKKVLINKFFKMLMTLIVSGIVTVNLASLATIIGATLGIWIGSPGIILVVLLLVMLWIVFACIIFTLTISILLFKSLQNKYQVRIIDAGIEKIYTYFFFLEKFYNKINQLLKPFSIVKIYVIGIIVTFLWFYIVDQQYSSYSNVFYIDTEKFPIFSFFALDWPSFLLNFFVDSFPHCKLVIY